MEEIRTGLEVDGGEDGDEGGGARLLLILILVLRGLRERGMLVLVGWINASNDERGGGYNAFRQAVSCLVWGGIKRGPSRD